MAINIHTFNYMVVTYGYFSLRSYDKDHCTKDELVILMIHKFLQISKGLLEKIPLNWAKKLK